MRKKVFVANLHSVIDVITNSSTEIFATATTSSVNNMKKLIDNILHISGSELTHADLFADIILIDAHLADGDLTKNMKEYVLHLTYEEVYLPSNDGFKYISKDSYDTIMAERPYRELDKVYDKHFNVDVISFISLHLQMVLEDMEDESWEDSPKALLLLPKDGVTDSEMCVTFSKLIDMFTCREFAC